MKVRERVQRARHKAAWTDPNVRQAFLLGYAEALRDIERTGLRPFREDAIRRDAERAGERVFGWSA